MGYKLLDSCGKPNSLIIWTHDVHIGGKKHNRGIYCCPRDGPLNDRSLISSHVTANQQITFSVNTSYIKIFHIIDYNHSVIQTRRHLKSIYNIL